MTELNPQPLPPRVRVFLPREAAYDLEKMQKITATVLGKLGSGGCHSGHVFDFLTLEDFVVNPDTFEVQEGFVGQRF